MQEHLESSNPGSVESSKKSRHAPALAKALWVLAAIVIGTAIVVPFYFSGKSVDPKVSRISGFINTHDLIQHIAVMQDFDKVLRAGVLYPRWLPDINNGYGIAWANFYPPAFFYLSSLFNAVFNDWGVTLFALSALGFAASGLAFYLLARTLYGAFASAIGGLLYMLLPYHVINLYWQGAMPQFMGFVFLPLVIYFAFRLGSQSRARYYAGLGLVYGVYLMTHFPVAYLMTYTLAFYALIWAAREKDWRIALRIALGMAIGLMLAAIYLLPAALEARFATELYSTIFHYHSTYITLLPLGGFGNLVNLSFTLQTLALVAAIAILRAFQKSANQGGKSQSTSLAQTRLWILMGVATTFMNTSFSIYVSKLIPKIDIVLFAWRWMAIASLFTSLCVAAAIDVLRVSAAISPKRRWAYTVAVSIVIASSLWLTGQGVIFGALSNPAHIQPTAYADAQYTPKGSTAPQNLPDTPPVVIQPEGGATELIRWEPYHREVAVRLDQPGEVRIKTYNFPGWIATIDGQRAPLSSDKDGVQVVSVPAGIHKIESSFVNTPPRTAGALLSALGLLAVVGLVALDRVREATRVAGEEASRKALYVRSLKPLAPVVAPLLIGAALLFWLSGGGRSAPASRSDAPAKAGASATPGTEAVLHIDGVPSVLAAVDERALDELINALAAKDNSKVDLLVQSAQVLRVANDTHLRILEFGGGKTKVRILQGEHLMAEVWVPERWVK